MGKELIKILSEEKLGRIYPNVTNNRKKKIEDISSNFLENYCCENDVSWHSAAKGEGISYFEDSRVVIPFCDVSRRSVFVQPYSSIVPKMYSEAARAHEFGHILLGHDKIESISVEEDEADYFVNCTLGGRFDMSFLPLSILLGTMSNIFFNFNDFLKSVFSDQEHMKTIWLDCLSEKPFLKK